MSIEKQEENFTIGQRLREVRERFGLSQEVFGDRIGTSGRTVKKYEGNETSPTAAQLATIHEMGGDVFYIVTGQRRGAVVALGEARADYGPAAAAAGNEDSPGSLAERVGRLPEDSPALLAIGLILDGLTVREAESTGALDRALKERERRIARRVAARKEKAAKPA